MVCEKFLAFLDLRFDGEWIGVWKRRILCRTSDYERMMSAIESALGLF